MEDTAVKYEIDRCRAQHEVLGMPIRDSLGTDATAQEIVSRRKAVRVQTDRLIQHGIYSNDPVALVAELVLTMTALGSSCVQLGMEPQLNDMANAARELIEDARIPWDKGLQVRDLQQAAIGCAMLEIIVHGIAAVLSLPYAEVFQVFHNAFVAGCEPDFEKVKALLRANGYQLKEEEHGSD